MVYLNLNDNIMSNQAAEYLLTKLQMNQVSKRVYRGQWAEVVCGVLLVFGDDQRGTQCD